MTVTMYKGFTNSPDTVITTTLNSAVTTIPVLDLSVFLPGPNLATLGTGIDSETILYTAKSAGSGPGELTGCTRAFDVTGTFGAAKSWAIGTPIARIITRYDYDALVDNITGLKLDDLVTPDDNTDLDASTAKHGLMPKYQIVSIPGGALKASDDTQHQTYNNTYTQVSSITIPAAYMAGSTFRVQFLLRGYDASGSYGRIYRNGSAVGEERHVAIDTFTTFTEDITGWTGGDTLTLHIHGTSGNGAIADNLRIYGLDMVYVTPPAVTWA